MTKEELKKEAEGYFKSICGDYNEEYERTGKRHYFVGFDIKNAYIASAEPREKRITELEAQIEKMKCPQNCRYGSISVWCDNSISIDCEKEKFLHEENWCDFCKNCKKWEIKEK